MTNFKIYEKTYGRFILPDEENNPVLEQIKNKENVFDEHVMEEFSSFLSKDRTIVDVGAYIGDQIVWYHNKVKYIYAFEPNVRNYYNLCANLLINNIYNITAYNFGLGEKEDVFSQSNSGPHSSFHQDLNGSLKFFSLDSLSLPACDLLKIDCEGSDLQVLKGALFTIRKYKPIIIFEILPPVARIPDEYIKFFTNINFSVRRIGKHNDYVAEWIGQ